jgi:hypothetical protein
VKLIEGLPPIDDEDVLAAIIRERPSAFFLQNGAALRTTGVRLVNSGSAWAAAINAREVDSVRGACAALRIRLASIAPCAVVMPLAVTSAEVHREDGSRTMVIGLSDAGLTSVRTLPSALVPSISGAETVPPLSVLGERAECFADAYGAAVAPIGDPLTLGPAGDVPWNRRRLRRRVLPPTVVGSIAAMALALSPLVPLATARRAEVSLRTIQESREWHMTVDVLGQLERVTSVISEIERFGTDRQQRIRLLADLTRLLPDSAAIERFEIRNDEVRLVAIAPRASSVIAAIRTLPDVTSITLPGEVIRASIGGRDLERVAVTFRLSQTRDRVASGRDAS